MVKWLRVLSQTSVTVAVHNDFYVIGAPILQIITLGLLYSFPKELSIIVKLQCKEMV